MKTLILARHAKSSWDDPALPDEERPLNPRGLREAPAMGARLREHGAAPDAILSSPAVRALSTARLLAAELAGPAGDEQRVITEPRLYAASPDELLGVIRGLDDGLDCVLLVGHNPGFAALAARLDPSISHMPTGAIAEFRLPEDDWAHVGQTAPVDAWFASPAGGR